MSPVEQNNDPAVKATLLDVSAADATLDTGGIPCRGLYVGGAGHVDLVLADDSAAVLFSNVPAGTILPLRAKTVKTGTTTATLIVALY